MSYCYIMSEPGLFTTGFYDPAGKWHPDGDCTDREVAADRVAYLNGGRRQELQNTIWVARVLWLEDRRDSIIALFSTIEKAQAWVAEMIVMNPPKDCGRCGYAAHTVFEVHLDSGKCL